MFDTQAIILIIIFLVSYTAIAAEHKIKINKSWTAILAGSLMWIIVSWGHDPHSIHDKLIHETAEIFSLVIFLLGAMTVVEMMGHFRFFTWLEIQLLRKNISNKKLFWILGGVTFIGSSILDNLTITLIMIQIGRRLYLREENFNIFVINTVIAANAGGAFSPVGDVTTIMIWLAGKFTAWQVIFGAFIPSVVAWAIPQALLTRSIAYEEREGQDLPKEHQVQWLFVSLGMLSFGFAVMVNLFHLPPFIGILLGLGMAGIIIDYKSREGNMHYKAGQIVNLIQHADLSTLKFFTGILLAVGALSYHGVLDQFMNISYGEDPQLKALIIGHSAAGIVSSIFDNVPLTAAIIKMIPDSVNYSSWVLLAITAGTGGSILLIGSAPGVAAMGQVPSLTFMDYFKKGSLAALLGYTGAVGTWIGLNSIGLY